MACAGFAHPGLVGADHPAGPWIRRGRWSVASAKVHGICRSDLVAHGQSPAWVAAALNAALGPGGVAWCNGNPYDTHWAGILFAAAGVEPLFILDDWDRLTDMLGKGGRERALAWLKRAPQQHRARADAEQLLLALAHATGADPGSVQDANRHIPALLVGADPNGAMRE